MLGRCSELAGFPAVFDTTKERLFYDIKMEKGYFSYKVELNYGTNKLNLVAEDMAGNKSAYSATVKCELNKKSRFDMYIVSGVIGLLLICYMIVFVKGFKRKRADK